ncbi:wax synthase family protein [Sporobolomyces salmoneus]|uniref:wax synthase family protein n=1 Tax=Sporobolomyces salmoneus TaxID=183962 RepID=UPI003170FE02
MLSLERLIPPRDQLEPLGLISAVSPPLLLLTLLLSHPSRFLKSTILPLFIFSAIFTSLRYTTGSAADDYARASLSFTFVLRAIDAFLLSKPSFELAFKRSKEEEVPTPWSMKRLGWALKWITTMRGAGWEWQVIPKDSGGQNSLSRQQYLRRRLAKLCLTYLALDVTSTYMQSRPYFRRAVPLSSLPPTESIFNMLAACAAAALALNTAYQLVCIVCVASHIWHPDECVDLFGSLRDAKSLAGFWGKTWHQSFRRPFTSIPTFVVAKLCPSSPRSSLRPILNIFGAFSLSALVHAFSSFAMARTGSGSLRFFLVQPFGIVFETVVSHLCRNLQGIGWRRTKIMVGYVWTASWLLWFWPWFFDEAVQVSN